MEGTQEQHDKKGICVKQSPGVSFAGVGVGWLYILGFSVMVVGMSTTILDEYITGSHLSERCHELWGGI